MDKKNIVIWAGVVAYYPDLTKLGNLVNVLEHQVDKVLVFNNGGCIDVDIARLFQGSQFEIVGSGENVGIAKALNEICISAAKNAVDFVVTFDQDSAPSNDLVSKLHNDFSSLRANNINVAAVGPVFVDKRGNNEVLPVFQASRFWIKKIYPLTGNIEPISASILITSGMLLSVSFWKQIGNFRDDFFIDHVDTEWCLRALSSDFKLFVCPSVVMQHELSDEAPKRVFGRLVLKYSPIRRYYAFRNTIALIKVSFTPYGFRFYLLATLCYRFFINLLVDENKIKSLVAMLTGVGHGLTGKMGRLP